MDFEFWRVANSYLLIQLKGYMTDEDFMIQVLNNLPKEKNVILNGLKNSLMVSGDDVLTIDVICKK